MHCTTMQFDDDYDDDDDDLEGDDDGVEKQVRLQLCA